MNKLKTIAVSGISLLVVGCSTFDTNDKFSCPGIERGAQCLSIVEAKKLTDDPNWREKIDGDTITSKTVKVPTTPLSLGAAAAPLKQPVPILKPAEVLRIWIAPWNDDSTDLYWPSYVFTEITPRKWTFGENSIKNTQVLTPVRFEKSEGDGSGVDNKSRANSRSN